MIHQLQFAGWSVAKMRTHFGSAAFPASELSNTILSTAISQVSRIAALSCLRYLRSTGRASSLPIAPIASAACRQKRRGISKGAEEAARGRAKFPNS